MPKRTNDPISVGALNQSPCTPCSRVSDKGTIKDQFKPFMRKVFPRDSNNGRNGISFNSQDNYKELYFLHNNLRTKRIIKGFASKDKRVDNEC